MELVAESKFSFQKTLNKASTTQKFIKRGKRENDIIALLIIRHPSIIHDHIQFDYFTPSVPRGSEPSLAIKLALLHSG